MCYASYANRRVIASVLVMYYVFAFFVAGFLRKMSPYLFAVRFSFILIVYFVYVIDVVPGVCRTTVNITGNIACLIFGINCNIHVLMISLLLT